jgi:hypothetical protein
LLAALLAMAASMPPVESDELAQRQRLWKSIRGDAEHAARLKGDLAGFRRLRPELRERMQRLDAALHAELSGTQVRLLRTAERYVAWLQRLPAEQRQAIEAAPNAGARLERIREIRRAQWLEQLPKAEREQIQRAPENQRAELVRELREHDFRARRLWQLAVRHWDRLHMGNPAHQLSALPPNPRNWVRDYVRPQLSPQEDKLLLESQDTGVFPFVLMELIEKHPVLLPGPTHGPADYGDLPHELQQELAKYSADAKKTMTNAKGKWPGFALAVTAFAQQHTIKLPKPLGPSRPEEFPESWKPFFQQLHDPAHGASKDELKRLQQLEGFWPAYPQRLLAIALRHHLAAPQGAPLALPGQLPIWVRTQLRMEHAGQPLVGDLVLLEFARTELKPEERDKLGVALGDMPARRQLQEKFGAVHRDEWLALELSDHKKKTRAEGK